MCADKTLRQNGVMRRVKSYQPASAHMRRMLVWLVAALLFGQSFGALHRIVHAPVNPVVPTSARVAQGPDGGRTPAGQSVLARWFGAHSANDCALIDHALQPTPPAVSLLPAVPVAFAAVLSAAMAGLMPAGCLSFFQARAPPALLVRTSSL